MVSAKRLRISGPDPGPTVFVLFGATGDLAKRLVLPAFYRLAIEGLLPRRWLLVGNGRGDVAHEEFRAHVYDALTEFGPHPQQGRWESFAQRVLFAGGGFNTGDPGSFLDALAKARTSLGRGQLVHQLSVAPVAVAGMSNGFGDDRLADGARAGFGNPL